jgi:hypothetical protein
LIGETGHIPAPLLAESSRLIDKLAIQGLHMPTDSNARAGPPPATAEDDYRSFCAALSESARGRDFLAEFARRNRHAGTEMLLAGLDRLAALMRAEGTAQERLRDELRMLLIAIRLARPDIDAARPLTKAAKLATLLDQLERRIDAMVEGKVFGDKPADLALPAETKAGAPPIEIGRAQLSVVPLSDEPELPIPAPPAVQPLPPISLVRKAVAMPDVTFIVSAPLGPTVIEPAVVEPVLVEKVAPTVIALPIPVAAEVAAPKAAAALPPVDPLAPIMALSEAERIALFT